MGWGGELILTALRGNFSAVELPSVTVIPHPPRWLWDGTWPWRWDGGSAAEGTGIAGVAGLTLMMSGFRSMLSRTSPSRSFSVPGPASAKVMGGRRRGPALPPAMALPGRAALGGPGPGPGAVGKSRLSRCRGCFGCTGADPDTGLSARPGGGGGFNADPGVSARPRCRCQWRSRGSLHGPVPGLSGGADADPDPGLSARPGAGAGAVSAVPVPVPGGFSHRTRGSRGGVRLQATSGAPL